MNLLNNIMQDAISSFAHKKETLIKQRMIFLGIDIPVNPDSNFSITIKGQEQTYWYKDVRIITFVESCPEFSTDNLDKNISVSITQTYY